MQNLAPQRLRQLRSDKGLSRQALAREARVSERQIARIESSSGDARKVRKYTIGALAKALQVTEEVLMGTKPLSDAGAEGSRQDALVAPQRLKALRKKRGMTRKQLAERSKVSERQITRIESSATAVRGTTLDRLAKALGVRKETLRGDGPPGLDQPAAPPTWLGFKVSPQLRLAYDLVTHRYGPSRREVIELAPLLFTLLAEASLAWRRQCLKEVEEAMERLSDLSEKSQLYFADYSPCLEGGLAYEEMSIAKADLRGDEVRSEAEGSIFGFAEDHLYAVTPFADYLRKLAKDLEISRKVDFFPETASHVAVGEFDMIWGADPYQVCRDELDEITGGSEIACSALAYGDVRLSDIPKELMAPDAKEKRVAWLEEKGGEGNKQRERLIRELIEFEAASPPTDAGNQEGDERHD